MFVQCQPFGKLPAETYQHSQANQTCHEKDLYAGSNELREVVFSQIAIVKFSASGAVHAQADEGGECTQQSLEHCNFTVLFRTKISSQYW